jgi:hypothetical protein
MFLAASRVNRWVEVWLAETAVALVPFKLVRRMILEAMLMLKQGALEVMLIAGAAE